jgi:hypothetical protein
MESFDWNNLQSLIKEATKQAFIEIFNKHNKEDVYSFALYSDEGAMTVCPAANTMNHLLQTDEEDRTYYKFDPVEWKYEGQGADALFDKICDLVRSEVLQNEDDEIWFISFKKKLYDTCIDVLTSLKTEDFFKSIAGKDIFLIFTVTEHEFKKSEIKKIITQLNENPYKDEYLSWMITWGK